MAPNFCEKEALPVACVGVVANGSEYSGHPEKKFWGFFFEKNDWLWWV